MKSLIIPVFVLDNHSKIDESAGRGLVSCSLLSIFTEKKKNLGSSSESSVSVPATFTVQQEDRSSITALVQNNTTATDSQENMIEI